MRKGHTCPYASELQKIQKKTAQIKKAQSKKKPVVTKLRQQPSKAVASATFTRNAAGTWKVSKKFGTASFKEQIARCPTKAEFAAFDQCKTVSVMHIICKSINDGK